MDLGVTGSDISILNNFAVSGSSTFTGASVFSSTVNVAGDATLMGSRHQRNRQLK